MSNAEEETKSRILTQVEFYFSDSNLLNDRFLFTTQQANDGWVPISVLSQFERMKKYRPIELIVEALRGSKDFLEVSENGELVRRKVPLPTNHNQVQLGIAKRSVVAESFPADSTLDELLEFFSKIGSTNQVRMKRKHKEFTGSVIVEFKSEEDATKLLETEPKPKFKDIELKIISKVAYDESKAQSFGQRRGSKGRGRKARGHKHDEDRKREESPKREGQEYRERDEKEEEKGEEKKEKEEVETAEKVQAREKVQAGEKAQTGEKAQDQTENPDPATTITTSSENQ
ncbi:DEKNAAC102095 [Brettanomyces naardenensis]|uniref:DEKNAAC102095 n=1 Tax=Brettanomyces naardenensis TaxID=13370 RepID=A0A448YJS8_BRENA|nr:DEKNAAC102095 [Brettanomyces naardenensis]